MLSLLVSLYVRVKSTGYEITCCTHLTLTVGASKDILPSKAFILIPYIPLRPEKNKTNLLLLQRETTIILAIVQILILTESNTVGLNGMVKTVGKHQQQQIVYLYYTNRDT